MALRIDQDSRRMMVAQAQPTDGFRPQQAHDHIRFAGEVHAELNQQMDLVATALASATPVGTPLGKAAELIGITMWELAQAMSSMGLSTEAVMGALRERVLTGTMFDIRFLVRSQLFVAVGPLVGEELTGSLVAGLPIAGDEIASYAVIPEPPPEPPLLETPP